MLKFFHKLLFFAEPEIAHHIAILALKNFPIQSKPTTTKKEILPLLPNLSFSSRIGLAAGFDKNAEVFPALANFGFGFIEVGTVTPLAQPGNPAPRLWRTDKKTLVNKMGFNNCGLKQFKENIIKGRKKSKTPVFANIGKNKTTPNDQALEDYKKGFEALSDCVDGFIVNISSPNTPGLRTLQSEEFLKSLESFAPKNLPVFVKFSADLSLEELTPLLEYLKRSTYRGVVLVNTSSKLALSFAGKSEGGLSGTILFEIALEKVKLAKKILGEEKIIIGVGGVSSKEDFLQMREAGADLIEIYTAFIYQGISLVKELAELA